MAKMRPSIANAAKVAPPSGANWGSRLVKKTAIFGLPRSLITPWRKASSGVRHRLAAPSVPTSIAFARLQRAPQRLAAENDEIGGSRQLDGEEHRLRCDQQGDDADAGREGPDRLPGGDPERGEDAAPPAAEERVANGQRGVGTGRRDDEDGYAEEGQEMVAHGGDLRSRAKRTSSVGIVAVSFDSRLAARLRTRC